MKKIYQMACIFVVAMFVLSGCEQRQNNEAAEAKIQCMREQGILFVKVKSGGEAGSVEISGIDMYGNIILLEDDAWDTTRKQVSSEEELYEKLLDRMNEQLTNQTEHKQIISEKLLKKLLNLEYKELEPLNETDMSGCDGFVCSYYLIQDLNGEKNWVEIYRNDSFGNEWGHPDDKEQVIGKEVCEIFGEEWK